MNLQHVESGFLRDMVTNRAIDMEETNGNMDIYGYNKGCSVDRQTPVKKDDVNNPDHYTSGGIETIDFIEAKLTQEGLKGYYCGNILKYMSRAGKKVDELQDLKKARYYLNRLIDRMEGTK